VAEADVLVESERLILRPIQDDEAATILRGGLPEMLSFAPGYPAQFSLEVMDILAGERRGDAIDFRPCFIVRKEDECVIGEIGCSFPEGPQAAVVGYEIVEPLWNQGYTTEALRALIAYLFTLPEVEVVKADTLKDLIASRRVMEKAGMSLVGEGTSDVDGETAELVYYEIRRPE
jgi:RimJ/RimL family protein N-acetyltransferase